MSSLLVVTDLDGTLLDDAYGFDAARPALRALAARDIPLVINSSKTAGECRYWQRQLQVSGPFICENGAAVLRSDAHGSVETLCELAQPRAFILEVLAGLRAQGFVFEGFADWDVERVIAATGLPRQQAELALARDYSEPLLLTGDAAQRAAFTALLAEHELVAVQGGRFLTVTSRCDKGSATRWLAQHLGGDFTTVALGDSPNDTDMLQSADVAVIVASPRGPSLRVDGPDRIIRTTEAGPAGWQSAISTILAETLHG